MANWTISFFDFFARSLPLPKPPTGPLERGSADFCGSASPSPPSTTDLKSSQLPRIAPQRNYAVPPRPRIAPQCYIVATQRLESRLSGTTTRLSGTFPPLSALRAKMKPPRVEIEGRRDELGQGRGDPVARREDIGSRRGGLGDARREPGALRGGIGEYWTKRESCDRI
jgi:hypothetical protein